MHLKNDELRSLAAKLRVVECEDLDKSTALNNTQEQLLVMSEQHSQASLHMQDMEVWLKNIGLIISPNEVFGDIMVLALPPRLPRRREHSNSKNIQPISFKFYM